jgi:FkbM family methyltransferase
MEPRSFKFGTYNILYPEPYFHFLKEVFILDVYRTNLLQENDLVLDLGASTGDFCILASKKVGKNGKVVAIEPHIESYELLKMNIQRNNCKNIIPVNLGVGCEKLEKEITFWNRSCMCKINTLENILDGLRLNKKINFIKMDIEGIEADIIHRSIETIKEANVISLEFHGTKEKVDEALIHHGFSFEPITMRYIYKKIVKNFFLHPIALYEVYVDTITKNPNSMRKAITGFDMTKDHLLVGSYIKDR